MEKSKMEEDKLKNIGDLKFEFITDVYTNRSGEKRYTRRGAVFSYQIRKEAVKHYKQIKDENTKRWIKEFFQLTDELINDENKLIRDEGAQTKSDKKQSKILSVEVLQRLRDILDSVPLEDVY